MSEIVIRKYEKRDRESIRALCFATGDKGQSAANFFNDSELYADLWTLYYTDIESESTWIAECNHEFAGYISCCFNERKNLYATVFYVLPPALTRALARGSLFDKKLWKLLFGSLKLHLFSKVIEYSASFSKKDLDAHLHINLVEKFRGQNIGAKLLATAMTDKRCQKGFSAGIRADNEAAEKFFERQGFVKLERQPGFFLPGRGAIEATLLGRKKI